MAEAASIESKISFHINLINAAEWVINTSFISKTSTINFIFALNNETKHEQFTLINDLILRCHDNGVVLFVENVESIQPRHRLFNVVFVDDFKSFLRFFRKVSAETFVIDGFYLMIFVHGLVPVQLSEITKLLWSIFLFNIDFLAAESDVNEDVNLWTFIPFTSCENDTCHDRKCGDTTAKVINTFINGSFTSTDNHENDLNFPEKISNLHRCPVKIVTFNAPPMMMIKYPIEGNRKIFRLLGVDGEMIELMSRQLNFTIDLFHISDNIRWGSLSANGTSTGAMRMVMDNEADFTVGMYTITYLRSKVMTNSEFYYQVPFIMIVPPGSQLSAFEKLFRPFSLVVWILLLLTFSTAFLVITIIKFQKNFLQEFIFGNGNRSPYLNVLIGFVGGSQTVEPQRNFARFLLIMYLLFCLVKRSLYQGALFQFLQTDDRHSEVQSIDEVAELNFKVYMLPSSLEHTQNMKFRDRRVWVNSTVLLEKTQATMNPSSKHVVTSSLEQVLYFNKINYKEHTLTVCREYLFTYLYGIYFRKNSYLVHMFNQNIALFKTSGLIDFWASDYISMKYLNMHIVDDGPKQLNIDQLLGGFEVLFIGMIGSLILFVLEVMAVKCRMKRLQKVLRFFI